MSRKRGVRSRLSVAVAMTSVLMISICAGFAQQSPTGELTGNWAVRNVNNTEGTVRSTYFNLKHENGKITGTIRVTQFFYTIKESTGDPEGFTLIASMMDGRSERAGVHDRRSAQGMGRCAGLRNEVWFPQRTGNGARANGDTTRPRCRRP